MRIGSIVKQLRDAKVQEFYHTIASNEDDGRFDISMNNKLAVRMRDCGENVDEQTHARLDIELMPLAIRVNRLAFDVFEDQVGLSRLQNPRIEEARDIRVIEAAEDIALELEAMFPDRTDPRRVHKFNGNRALVAAVGPPCAPDAAHAAAANLSLNLISAHPAADQRSRLNLLHRQERRARHERRES